MKTIVKTVLALAMLSVGLAHLDQGFCQGAIDHAPGEVIVSLKESALSSLRLAQAGEEVEEDGGCKIEPDFKLYPDAEYCKGHVGIVFQEDELAIIDSVFKAAEGGSIRTGIASFDSLGVTYNLKFIEPPYVHPVDPSLKVRGIYLLIFFEEEDRVDANASPIIEKGEESETVEIAKSYCKLPYVKYVTLNSIIRIFFDDVSEKSKTWGIVKSTFR